MSNVNVEDLIITRNLRTYPRLKDNSEVFGYLVPDNSEGRGLGSEDRRKRKACRQWDQTQRCGSGLQRQERERVTRRRTLSLLVVVPDFPFLVSVRLGPTSLRLT